jgi:hypothetical protein
MFPIRPPSPCPSGVWLIEERWDVLGVSTPSTRTSGVVAIAVLRIRSRTCETSGSSPRESDRFKMTDGRRRSFVTDNEYSEFKGMVLFNSGLNAVDDFQSQIQELEYEESMAAVEAQKRLKQFEALKRRKTLSRQKVAAALEKRRPLIVIEDVGILQEALAKAMIVISDLRQEKEEYERRITDLKASMNNLLDNFMANDGERNTPPPPPPRPPRPPRRQEEVDEAAQYRDMLKYLTSPPTSEGVVEAERTTHATKADSKSNQAIIREQKQLKAESSDGRNGSGKRPSTLGGDEIVEEYLRLKAAQEEEEEQCLRRLRGSMREKQMLEMMGALIEPNQEHGDQISSLAQTEDSSEQTGTEETLEGGQDSSEQHSLGVVEEHGAILPTISEKMAADDTVVSESIGTAEKSPLELTPKDEQGVIAPCTPENMPNPVDSDQGKESNNALQSRTPNKQKRFSVEFVESFLPKSLRPKHDDKSPSRPANETAEEKEAREKKERKEKAALLLGRYKEDHEKRMREEVDHSAHTLDDPGGHRAPSTPDVKGKDEHPGETPELRQKREKQEREEKTKKLLGRYKKTKEDHQREEAEGGGGSFLSRFKKLGGN